MLAGAEITSEARAAAERLLKGAAATPPPSPGRGAAFFMLLSQSLDPTKRRSSLTAPAQQRTAPRRATRCAASGARPFRLFSG